MPFCISFEKKNFLLPWIGLTMVGPFLFLAYLIMDLLFLNFTAVTRLLLKEGIAATVTLYLVTTVYSLYLEMAAPPTFITDDAFDEENTGQGKRKSFFKSLLSTTMYCSV